MNLQSPVLLVPASLGLVLAATRLVPLAAATQDEAPAPSKSGLVRVFPQGSEEPLASFDAEAWRERLGAADLDAREAAFAELVELARHDGAARAWIDAARAGADEIAWSARLAWRELEALRPRSPFDVWGGTHDLDEFERMVEEFTQRMAPGWNHRLDPFVVPFPGLQKSTPIPQGIAPGQSQSSKQVEVQGGSEGWTIRIQETIDGQDSVREFQGKTLEEILEANPELRGEVGVSGALLEPGFSLRIGSQAGEPFDFDSLFGSLGVRPSPLAAPFGGPEPTPMLRTDLLGILARPATAEEGGEGLYVRSTVPGTIAQLLGIAGGDIVLEVNGKELASVEDVTAALAERGPDGRVEAVWKDASGRRRTGTWRP